MSEDFFLLFFSVRSLRDWGVLGPDVSSGCMCVVSRYIMAFRAFNAIKSHEFSSLI